MASTEPGTSPSTLVATRDDATFSVTVAGDGPPLLFLHGLTGQAAVARDEAPAGYRVATFDQRGHASGPKFSDPAAYAIDEFVADASVVLDVLGWERAIIVGESMGAAVALRLALDSPGRVAALALVGPAFSDSRNEATEVFDAMSDRLATGGVAAAIDAARARLREQGVAPEVTAWFDAWHAHDAAALACAVRVVSRWVPFPRLDQCLGGLGMPLAVVGWPGDPMHPLALAERVAAAGGGRLHRLGSVADVLGNPSVVGRTLGDCLAAVRSAQ